MKPAHPIRRSLRRFLSEIDEEQDGRATISSGTPSQRGHGGRLFRRSRSTDDTTSNTRCPERVSDQDDLPPVPAIPRPRTSKKSVKRWHKSTMSKDSSISQADARSHWLIANHMVTIGNILSGSFGDIGCVLDGQLSNEYGSSVPVALLTITQSCCQQRAFFQQASLLTNVNKLNVVRFFGVTSFGHVSYVLMELCARGTLSSELQRRGPTFPLTTLFEMAMQISRGLKYLEEKNIVHSNLRASSIYIAANGECKVGNFSLMQSADVLKYLTDNIEAERIRSRLKHKIPYQWAPPEVFNTSTFSLKSVVWCYGTLLWEMFSHGAEPWPKLGTMEILEQIDQPRQNRLAKPCHCPVDIYSLMQRCWNHEPADRPMFTALESLVRECYPQQARVTCEEVIAGDGTAGMLSLIPDDMLTIVEKQTVYWFAQNQHGEYGEFRYDCVEIITDTKVHSPEEDRRSPQGRTPGDGVEAASISEPINFKHDLHVSGLEDMTDEELVKMFEEKTQALKNGSTPASSTSHLGPVGDHHRSNDPLPEVPGTTASRSAERSSASLHRAWTASQAQKPASKRLATESTSASVPPEPSTLRMVPSSVGSQCSTVLMGSVQEYDEVDLRSQRGEDEDEDEGDNLIFDPDADYLDMSQGKWPSASDLAARQGDGSAAAANTNTTPVSARRGQNTCMANYETMMAPRQTQARSGGGGSVDDEPEEEYVAPEITRANRVMDDYTDMNVMSKAAREAIDLAMKKGELSRVQPASLEVSAATASANTALISEQSALDSMEVNKLYHARTPLSPSKPAPTLGSTAAAAAPPRTNRPVPAPRHRKVRSAVHLLSSPPKTPMSSSGAPPSLAKSRSTYDTTAAEPGFLRTSPEGEATTNSHLQPSADWSPVPRPRARSRESVPDVITPPPPPPAATTPPLPTTTALPPPPPPATPPLPTAIPHSSEHEIRAASSRVAKTSVDSTGDSTRKTSGSSGSSEYVNDDAIRMHCNRRRSSDYVNDIVVRSSSCSSRTGGSNSTDTMRPDYVNARDSQEYPDDSLQSVFNRPIASLSNVSTLSEESVAIQHRYINDHVRSSTLLESHQRPRAHSNEYMVLPEDMVSALQAASPLNDTATPPGSSGASHHGNGDSAADRARYDVMSRDWRPDSDLNVPPASMHVQIPAATAQLQRQQQDFGPATPPLVYCPDMSVLVGNDNDSDIATTGAASTYNTLDMSTRAQPSYSVAHAFESVDLIPYATSTPPLPPKKKAASRAKSAAELPSAAAADTLGYDAPHLDSTQPQAAGVGTGCYDTVAKSSPSPPIRHKSKTNAPSPLTVHRMSAATSPSDSKSPPISRRQPAPESPAMFAQNLVEQLPDLKFADVMVALQAYESPQVTETHLRAQLVLDVYNRLCEMGYKIDMTRCELAMKHCRWKKDRAVDYLVRNPTTT
ncbi:ack-related non-receptor tyrosine kinase-like isoform X2 [Sycon ciliatum]|uniref:ack-related non-receptor tyrosine kinase-like isoform X2 n=1 Tax=Sycon ciliatum TaxID=27933 RepID=UPI0031F623F0